MNSIFHSEITEYLALREKVLAPRSFAIDRRTATSFDQHLVRRNVCEKQITEADVLSWIQPLYDRLARKSVANQVGFLRMLLKHFQYKGIPVYMPPYPTVPDSYIPYLFSAEELETIFTAADNEPFGSDFRQMEMPMLLRMLYSCGFRLGELLAAHVGDVNFRRGVILLRDTKNRRQRIVPMGDALTAMLNSYCLAMDLLGSPDNYLFPARDRNKHLSHSTADLWFRELLKRTGIYVQPEEHAK